ncbi:hypothetical protein [Microbacterium sp. SLBN-146]|uniref:hypothetical protein n=1 Tax=Microbacterium sp. SLBN-146 TaxID=2768457 RepID=UPI00115377AE|nr:hypothetical protein [Microbacterium sp. SLBN-146]TQJ30143.1 hypothetical protein FBY39_0588 [Microbacterium sp. SLBN-146]
MADDIDVDLDDLRLMTARLHRFITEFEEIAAHTDDVEEAVGRPTGDGRLRSRVAEFESGWNGNREVIQESLTNVHDHLRDFIDTIEELDVNLSRSDEE